MKYIEALIGPHTINTVPSETLAAYRDHSQPAIRLDADAAKAAAMPGRLKELGIDLDAATQKLEKEGVQKFAKAFDGLIKAIKEKQSMAQPVKG